jgi:hypothetical protein
LTLNSLNHTESSAMASTDSTTCRHTSWQFRPPG